MIKDMDKEAGARIQQLRVKRGYSRERLAESAGVSDKFLYEVESGKKGFSASVLLRIADALEVSCDYILNGRRGKGNYDPKLLEMIELFDEKDMPNIIHLMEVLYEMVGQGRTNQ